MRPGETSMSGLAATGIVASPRAALDQDEGEQAADETVEDDCLGERETEPLDALELAAELGLARDGLDHRAEDVADADAGTERAEADAERERDRLAGIDAVLRGGDEHCSETHAGSSLGLVVLGLDGRADVDGGQGGEDVGLDRHDDDELEEVEDRRERHGEERQEDAL